MTCGPGTISLDGHMMEVPARSGGCKLLAQACVLQKLTTVCCVA